jgi:hypothetical protein
MKAKKRQSKAALKAAAKAGLMKAIDEATGVKRAKRIKRGPEPERLKIDGDWEDAIATALQKPKPLGGWPKK